MSTEAFVLIGGRSRRFGSDKAFFEIGGKPLALIAAEKVEEALDNVRVRYVAATSGQFKTDLISKLGRPLIHDTKPGFGGWSALHGALSHSKAEWTFVVACDMPVLASADLRLLFQHRSDELDAVIPIQPDGRPQPFCGYYRTKTVLAVAEAFMRADGKLPPLSDLFSKIKTSFIQFSGGGTDPFLNLNDPSDLTAQDAAFLSSDLHDGTIDSMEIVLDKLREECGVFGIFGHSEASTLTQLGLFALQHRGQEACGIVSSDGQHLHQHRAIGLVADVLNPDVLQRLVGSSAIGHTRYSTTGRNTIKEVQPFSVTCQHGQIAVCHNGNLPFAGREREKLERGGAIFSSTSDTETILHAIARTPAKDVSEAVRKVLLDTEGAFSLLFLTPDSLIAIRDPRGFRPLVLGKYKDAWCVASETCAFDLMDATYEREIEPGEMLIINSEGLHSSRPFEVKPVSVCTFEHVYFSRPDSTIFGRSVNESRHKMGKRLAVEHPVDADLIVPVPDSGVAAAIGYARESGINFRQAIIRNHYVGRTFIEPSQQIRSFGVRLKLNPIKDLIKGRRIVLVDDSIVRGTTSKKIVEMVREAGATEVHMRISCPPTAHSCYYGVDTPNRKDLIASQMTVEQIRDAIGVETLGYLSLEGMLEAIGIDESRACSACWTGKYPTLIANGKAA